MLGWIGEKGRRRGHSCRTDTSSSQPYRLRYQKILRKFTRYAKRFKHMLFLAGCSFSLIFLYISSQPVYLSFQEVFTYPEEVEMSRLSRRILSGESVELVPINKHPYGYIYSPTDLCNSSKVYLLILVKSAVGHYHLRHAIRKTLIEDLYANFHDIKVGFLLGYSHQERFVVENEEKIHHDIIQENFTDAYRNNTLKTIMGYNWITEYCRNAKFILFLDDDMLLNVDLLQEFMYTMTPDMEENLYSGLLVRGGQPARDWGSKWYVPREEYPFDVYPDYIAGCAIIQSQTSVRKFQSVFPYVKYFGFDDVYLGIVAFKLGIQPQNNALLTNAHIKNYKNMRNLIAKHGFEDAELYFETYFAFKEKKGNEEASLFDDVTK